MNAYVVANSRIVLPGKIDDGKSVAVENGFITAVDHAAEIDSRFPYLPVVDGAGGFLTPGFVEFHIHGCGQVSVDAAVEEASVLPAMRDHLARFGINTFVPTLMCNPPLLEALAEQMEVSPNLERTIPGFYVEGPFVNVQKRGGILPGFVHPADLTHLATILELGGGWISLMTLAPELEGMEAVVERLDEKGITSCFGHSLATVSQAKRLIHDSSTRNITHLFNAMSGFSHKEAGLAALPFLDSRVYAELNGDGIHVNDEMVQLCTAHLDREKMILISDAVVTAGEPYGESVYYGNKVVSDENGVRYRDNNILIGSNLLIPQVLKRFMKVTGLPIQDALPFVTLNPCRLLGIEGRRGSIEVGKEADLLLLDEQLNLKENLTRQSG